MVQEASRLTSEIRLGSIEISFSEKYKMQQIPALNFRSIRPNSCSKGIKIKGQDEYMLQDNNI